MSKRTTFCIFVLLIAIAMLLVFASRDQKPRKYVGGAGTDVINNTRAQTHWNAIYSSIVRQFESKRNDIRGDPSSVKTQVGGYAIYKINEIMDVINNLKKSEIDLTNKVGTRSAVTQNQYDNSVSQYEARLTSVSMSLVGEKPMNAIKSVINAYNSLSDKPTEMSKRSFRAFVNTTMDSIKRELEQQIAKFTVESNMLRNTKPIPPKPVPKQPNAKIVNVPMPIVAPTSQPSAPVQPIVAAAPSIVAQVQQAVRQVVQKVAQVLSPAASTNSVVEVIEPLQQSRDNTPEQTSTPTWEKLNVVLHHNDESYADKVKFVIMHRLKHQYPGWTKVDLGVITPGNAEHIGDAAVQRSLDAALNQVMDERFVGLIGRPSIARFMKLHLASGESSIVRKLITAGEINQIERVFADLYKR